MIKPIVAGNWKMNKTPSEGNKFSLSLIENLNSISDTDVIICPPFTGLTSVVHSDRYNLCLLYTSPSPRDATLSRMPSSA